MTENQRKALKHAIDNPSLALDRSSIDLQRALNIFGGAYVVLLRSLEFRGWTKDGFITRAGSDAYDVVTAENDAL
jgi:hypothetical protein